MSLLGKAYPRLIEEHLAYLAKCDAMFLLQLFLNAFGAYN